jgi:hypothetical protein
MRKPSSRHSLREILEDLWMDLSAERSLNAIVSSGLRSWKEPLSKLNMQKLSSKNNFSRLKKKSAILTLKKKLTICSMQDFKRESRSLNSTKIPLLSSLLESKEDKMKKLKKLMMSPQQTLKKVRKRKKASE